MSHSSDTTMDSYITSYIKDICNDACARVIAKRCGEQAPVVKEMSRTCICAECGAGPPPTLKLTLFNIIGRIFGYN